MAAKKTKPRAKRKPPKRKPKPKPKPAAKPDRGQAHRDREAARRRELSKSVKEIGPLPPIKDPKRRARGRASLKSFAVEYFPNRFKLAFAEPHTAAIARMEECTDHGGKFAAGMPRGMGKTTLAEVAVIRAVLYGLRRFVMLVCATGPLAKRRLKQILRELESNQRLYEDFPEVCYCIRKLDRMHQRAGGQTLNGVPTRMEMTATSIVLPTVAGSAASGSVLVVSGMGAAVRGLNVLGPNGEPLRPDMVLLDDVQTRKSAYSPSQTSQREAMILADILGSAAGDVEIAAVMLCTVIAPGDLSDRFLSHDIHPEWQGVRTRMLEEWPADMVLWDQYAEARRESFRSGDRGQRGNEFYDAHREAMDAGARVSWPERMKPGELSGIQSAMNLYYADPKGFRAEYQNDPDPVGASAAKQISPVHLVTCLSGLHRFEIPREASRIVAFIDAGGGRGRGLWYGVLAVDNDFGGSVVDYGPFPRQARSMFLASDMRPGLAEAYPALGEDERLYRGLTDLTEEVLGRTYLRETTGEQLRVERCLIDCGWKSQTIHKFIRESKYANSLYPSKGVGRSIQRSGVSEWKPRPGERSGFHWRLTISETGRGRMVQFDPDMWKTFLFERFTTAPGGRGRLTLFAKDGREPVRNADHEMLAAHCNAETATSATLRGSTFDKWSERPGSPDNHLFDVLTGCLVASSVQGLVWSPGGSTAAPSVPSGPARRFSDIQREKLARTG
jgi:hypothetical protein